MIVMSSICFYFQVHQPFRLSRYTYFDAGVRSDYFDEEKITDFDHFTVSRPWYELTGPRDYLAVFPDEPMKFSPGTHFSYSNGGYILLGVVIEELTGLKYQDYVEQSIFRAIGITFLPA